MAEDLVRQQDLHIHKQVAVEVAKGLLVLMEVLARLVPKQMAVDFTQKYMMT